MSWMLVVLLALAVAAGLLALVMAVAAKHADRAMAEEVQVLRTVRERALRLSSRSGSRKS